MIFFLFYFYSISCYIELIMHQYALILINSLWETANKVAITVGSSSGLRNLITSPGKSFKVFRCRVLGNVYLDVRKPGFPGSIVLMRISGKEKCRWEETRTVSESDGKGGSHSRTETDVYHGKNQFYCHKFALHTFQSRELPPGQYVFPFQFTLFGHLPGSFDEKGHNF